jgi:hypothetical protein
MRIARAMTHFGEMTVEFTSYAATGAIVVRLGPPRRNPPQRLKLRVRHPHCCPIRAVWVNGLRHLDVDPGQEVIDLHGRTEPLEIRVVY